MAESAPSEPSPKPTTSIPKLSLLFTSFPKSSSLDAHIAHLNRVLASQSGIDATLLFVGYSLYFISSQIRRFAVDSSLRRSILTKLIALLRRQNVTPNDKAGTSINTSANALADGTKQLGSMCSEVRMFMRLWGTLKVYAGVKANFNAGPRDTMLAVLAWAQLAALTSYLIMEHGFFLATKGVLGKGLIAPQTMAKIFKTSIWVYGAYLGMDYVRLWRVWQVRERERKMQEQGKEKQKAEEVKKEREAQDAAWWRSLQVNMAYSPLCLHWGGVEGAALSDTWVGILGAWAGWIGMKEAWRVAA